MYVRPIFIFIHFNQFNLLNIHIKINLINILHDSGHVIIGIIFAHVNFFWLTCDAIPINKRFWTQ